MSPAHLRRMNIGAGILLKRLVAGPKYKSCKNDPRIARCQFLEPRFILRGIWSISYYDELMFCLNVSEGLDDHGGVVFRFETRNIKNIPIGLDAVLLDRICIGLSH